MRSRRVGCLVGLVAAFAMAVGTGSAGAASPVLEFQPGPLATFPIAFTASGGKVTAVLSNFNHEVLCTGSSGSGAITGPHSATGSYVFTGCEATAQGGPVSCQSEGANENEIRTPPVDAELVFIDQARHEVGMLLAPQGTTYMSFECFNEEVEATGSFLSPVGPINQEGNSFTASLSRIGAIQFPAEYESATGERRQAIPTAITEEELFTGTTGVELSFAIHTDMPLTVKAISAADVQRDEEAAARKRHDDEVAAAAKKRDEEEAAKKRLEEEAAKKKAEERAQQKARARQLSKALKQCRKIDSKQKRVRCEHRAKKRFAVPHPNRRY